MLALNLASRPFRNRALPWTIIACVALVSLAWLVFNFSARSTARAEARLIERDMVVLREQTKRIEEENARMAEEMSPADLQTLRAAHRLIDRKAFSWTQLFSDLEAAMPPTVRLTRIAVGDVAQNANMTVADIAVTVIGRTSDDVTGMIAQMNTGGTFLVTPLTQSTNARQGGGVEWTLQVNYTPPRAPAINLNGGEQAQRVMTGRLFESHIAETRVNVKDKN